MPLIEVDDVTAAAMQQNGVKYTDRSADARAAFQLSERIRKMEAGPRRAALLKLYKEEFPEVPIPEIDAAQPVMSEVAELRKEFRDYLDGEKKAREERDAKSREEQATKTVSQGRSWLRSKKKLDDEGVKGVEDIMQDRGLGDYEAAYLLWESTQPAAVDLPATQFGKSLDWFKHEENEPQKDLLLKDPLQYRAQRGRQILSDLRAGKIDEFGRPTQNAA